MRVIHLARKPLAASSVAANVLEHGAATINIDACRVGTTKEVPGGVSRTLGRVYNSARDGSFRRETGDEGGHNPNVGRWPANLILEHRERCRRVGTRQIRGSGVKMPDSRSRVEEHDWRFTEGTSCYADPDSGVETVNAWECVPGCPVTELDEQSGDRPVSGVAKTGRPATARDRGFIGPGGGLHGSGTVHNDAGGASRFYKQVGGRDE